MPTGSTGGTGGTGGFIGKPASWYISHSLWIVPIILGFGVFSFAGWMCAAAAVWGSFSALALLLATDSRLTGLCVGILVITWAASVAHAFVELPQTLWVMAAGGAAADRRHVPVPPPRAAALGPAGASPWAGLPPFASMSPQTVSDMARIAGMPNGAASD